MFYIFLAEFYELRILFQIMLKCELAEYIDL